MTSSENDLEQQPAGKKVRLAFAMPDWFRMIRVRRPLTPEEKQRLAAWFEQHLGGEPRPDLEPNPVAKWHNQFFVGMPDLRAFVQALNPAEPVFGQTRRLTYKHATTLTVFLSQVHSEHKVIYLSGLLSIMAPIPEQSISAQESFDLKRKEYYAVYDAWDIIRTWWSQRALPQLIEGAVSLPGDLEPITGNIEIVGYNSTTSQMALRRLPADWWG